MAEISKFPEYPEGVCETTGRWDASEYFRKLTASNRLAKKYRFAFAEVSDLRGFADILGDASLTAPALVCVSDTSNGKMILEPTPHIRQVKTVFLAMRHSVTSPGTASARAAALDTLRELFRQFMSAFAKEITWVSEGGLYVDPDISFSEIDRYFYSGCACAYFQISLKRYVNLIYRADEWNE